MFLGMPARRLREDRLLHKAEATGGDPRRIRDLFGLTVGAALGYTSTVDQAGLVEYTSATPGHGRRTVLMAAYRDLSHAGVQRGHHSVPSNTR